MYGTPIIASIISLLIGFAGAWQIQDWRFTGKIATINAEHSRIMAELADEARAAEATYRQIEANTRAIADEEREKSRAKVAAVNRELTATLDRLRNRPERNTPSRSEVPNTPSACAGSTGAELAKGDAEFLVRYAADAARLDAALDQCAAQYNALRNNYAVNLQP